MVKLATYQNTLLIETKIYRRAGRLVCWSKHQSKIKSDKRDAIHSKLPPILSRLGIEDKNWSELTTSFEANFKYLVGSPMSLDQSLSVLKRQRRTSIKNSQALLA